jgi:hypothetical protein
MRRKLRRRRTDLHSHAPRAIEPLSLSAITGGAASKTPPPPVTLAEEDPEVNIPTVRIAPPSVAEVVAAARAEVASVLKDVRATCRVFGVKATLTHDDLREYAENPEALVNAIREARTFGQVHRKRELKLAQHALCKAFGTVQPVVRL